MKNSIPIEMNDKEKTSEKKVMVDETGDKNSINPTNSINNSKSNSGKVQEINSQSQTNEDLYGNWLIKRTVAFGKVSSLSDEDINKLIGKRIEYSPNKASFGNDICENPKYKKSIISEKDFFENNGYTSFKELGLQGDSVIMVEIFCEKEDYSNFWYTIGGRIFEKDKNTLIANYEGVFFELVKDE
jgi:hypothetical protein